MPLHGSVMKAFYNSVICICQRTQHCVEWNSVYCNDQPLSGSIHQIASCLKQVPLALYALSHYDASCYTIIQYCTASKPSAATDSFCRCHTQACLLVPMLYAYIQPLVLSHLNAPSREPATLFVSPVMHSCLWLSLWSISSNATVLHDSLSDRLLACNVSSL